MQAKIVSIPIAEKSGEDLNSLGQVELVAGKGLVGDRHYSKQVNIGPVETRRKFCVDVHGCARAVN